MNRRLAVILGAALVAAACVHHYKVGNLPAPPPATAPAPIAAGAAPAAAGAPAAADADPPPKTEGDLTVAWVRGMQIIVKRAPGAEFVAGQLFVRGGTRDLTAANAGIEDVLFSVATAGGTKSLAKQELTRKLEGQGAYVYGYTANDYAAISTKSPRATWDDTFPIFVETFVAPALPATEFELARARSLVALHHEQEDGEGRLWHLLRQTLFAGHPYERRPNGTIETLTALKPGDLAPFLAGLQDTNRLLLVIVGDVDPAATIARARAAFAPVPRGTWVDQPTPLLAFAGSRVVTDVFALPTNYVESAFAGPRWTDPDFTPLRLGMAILSDRMFDEVRVKRNLSYAANAYLDIGTRAPFGMIYTTAVNPNAAMRVIFDEVQKLANDVYPAARVAAQKAVFRTGLIQSHETVDGQASDLGVAQICGGDWRLAEQNLERLQAVTPEAVHNAAHRWMAHMQTAIVGDPTKLDPRIVGVQ